MLVEPPKANINFRTGRNHTFHRYEHCFLELSRPQTKTEWDTKLFARKSNWYSNTKGNIPKPKFKFHLPGYDIYKNDRAVGTKGGVAILVKKSIFVNQEWKNEHFNVITDNEALAIDFKLQNGDNVILATIYCPNGNPSLRLFRMINALSKQVIFLRDFNSKHKQFGCAKPNKSGQTLVNIAKDLKLFYVNQLEPNRHTREDPVHGTSDILDMAL